MAECIEREAALAFPFANGQYDHKNADTHFINGCESYREWLEAIPAADVVTRDCYNRLLAENDELQKERPVRHGRWIEVDDSCCGFHATDIVCSECNKISEFGKFSYCPNCGARMDGDGE